MRSPALVEHHLPRLKGPGDDPRDLQDCSQVWGRSAGPVVWPQQGPRLHVLGGFQQVPWVAHRHVVRVQEDHLRAYVLVSGLAWRAAIAAGRGLVVVRAAAQQCYSGAAGA